MLEKYDSSNRNEWQLSFSISAGFTAKFALVFVFVVSFVNAISYRFHFKANRKNIGYSNKLYMGIFKKALCLRDVFWGMFFCENHWKISTLSILQLETSFLKNANLFEETKVPFSFLVENTKIENATFP